MDANALRELIANKRNLMILKAEIITALVSAPDPAALLLDAVIGPNPGEYGTCVGTVKAGVAFGCLQEIEHDPTLSVKERAKKLADVLWSFKNDVSAVLPLIRLIGAYKILDKFKLEGILDRIALFSKLKIHTVEACKSIGIRDHIPDLVEKLISKGKQFLALKFIDIFGLPEKYSLTPLLEAYIEESKKAAEVMRKEGKKDEAKVKELCALKLAIEYIVKYNLCAEWKEKLERNVAHLEQSEERTTVSAPSKPNDKKQGRPKQLNKRPRLAGSSPSPPAVHAQPSVMQAQPHLKHSEEERTSTVSAPSKANDQNQLQLQLLNKHPQLAGSSASPPAVHDKPSVLQTQPNLKQSEEERTSAVSALSKPKDQKQGSHSS